jgi:hypothetical protein
MSAPTCKLCHKPHWSYQSHQWSNTPDPAVEREQTRQEIVDKSTPVNKSTVDNVDKRTAYHREYARKRRAGKAAA